MKLFFLAASMIAFVLVIPISIGLYKDYKVISKGDIIKVKLTYISKGNGLIRFKMNDKIYDQRINRFSDFDKNIGDTINMRYLKGYKDNILFAEDNPVNTNLLLVAALLFCGIACLYYRAKNTQLW